ncbi:hypothetical protein MTO96_029179 [Rhipicephalus appendiculatus]
METGDEPLGNEADLQLPTDVQGPPSPVADSSVANADPTSAAGPAEAAAPAVQSPPQSSESAPAEGGATVAKPAASKKMTRAGPRVGNYGNCQRTKNLPEHVAAVQDTRA